ncbi:ZIP family metal transporter [Lutispora thermophila]|uniref:Zinc transporter, ZIP family n=1 Tax=Lutispora thermophila DSM 19022 TaxID=1122184 RepID=A0A1M6AMW0_9FIRM|nr:ZIP family metal transporter [Lutispora thermophila]SHI37737.1 zinc transporter, ZIP family [Lutispora thermophila DSM 19022]
MSRILAVTLIGFISGMVGTGLGGAMVFFIRNPGKRFMGTLLGFTGGIMLAVVCFDLMPHAFEIGGMVIGFAGILLGVTAVFMTDSIIPQVSEIKTMAPGFNKGFIKSGIILGLGIAFHNFPEGLAIGSGFAAANSMGLSLAIVIGLHDMPEGIAMAVPLRIGGYNRLKIVMYTIIAGIPTGIGAFVGALLGDISPALVSLCLGFAGGAMLYITCGELIPKTQTLYRGRTPTIGTLIGILVGFYITRVLG